MKVTGLFRIVTVSHGAYRALCRIRVRISALAMFLIILKNQPIHSISVDGKTRIVKVRLHLKDAIMVHIFKCTNLLGFMRLISQMYVEGIGLLPFISQMVSKGVLKEIPKDITSHIEENKRERALIQTFSN